MKKQDLIHTVAENTELTQKQASMAIDSVLNAIVAAVANGEKVQLVGFGTFEAKKRGARTGRNPRTKETIDIPETVSPVFKAGKAFKDAMK